MKNFPPGETCVHQQGGSAYNTKRVRTVTIWAWVLLAGICLYAAPAMAFRCGRRLVLLGNSQVAVWQKCGEPTTTEWSGTYQAVPWDTPYGRAPAIVYEPVLTEVWVYNRGPQRFVYEFVFREGRLVAIHSLGYGY